MGTKHTPGPWKINQSGSLVGVNFSVLARKQNGLVNILHGNDRHTSATRATVEEAKANARLIAAAPELLAALVACVSAYEQHRDGQPTGHLWPDPNHIHQARAAIAKATGATT